MDRREFLRGIGLATAGAVVGGTTMRLGTADAQSAASGRAALVERAFANEPGGAALRTTQVLWKVRTDAKVLALTFDDGPSKEWTEAMLDVLDDRKVRATFNLVGDAVQRHPEIVRREIAAKHQVENHSWSHQDLAFLSAQQAEREVSRGADALERVTGRRPQWFRPPRGDLSGAALAAVARSGADVMMWSLQLHERTMDAEQNVQFVLDRLSPGTVLLAHDAGGPHRGVGLRALPGIIDGARARGYEFLTVTDLVSAGQVVSERPSP